MNDDLLAMVEREVLRWPGVGKQTDENAMSHEKRASTVNGMMDTYELAKQRREEMAREVKRNRLAGELRAYCKRHAGRASA